MQTNPTLIFEYTLAFLQFWFALKRSLKVISKVIFKIKILETEGTNPHNQPILFC